MLQIVKLKIFRTMTRSSFSVLFAIRESKVRKSGNAPIEVTITVNGERTYFSTGKLVHIDKWDKAKQLVKGKDDEAKSLNQFLQAVRTRLYEKEAELMERGFVVTAELLRDAYFDKVEALKEKTLLEVLREHNEERKKMIGKAISPATYWVFEYSERLLKDFIKEKFQRKDIYLRELNVGFIQSFHAYLLQFMKQNTSSKHLKFLKQIVNLAVAKCYIAYNPLNIYKVEREPVDVDFLDEEELRRIINFDTPIPRFERARDMFLFGCFTGLSYIDIKTLTNEHIEKDDMGRVWIKKRRVKTGVLSRIPLLPIAKLILDKYKGGERLLPIQDPSDINKYLKDIAILCNINKRITFHTSRHTFASTVTLANNISIEVVSKMLGHTNTRMTTHYAKLLDKCIGEQMDKLMDSYEDIV